VSKKIFEISTLMTTKPNFSTSFIVRKVSIEKINIAIRTIIPPKDRVRWL
jgi:hypothetical protein